MTERRYELGPKTQRSVEGSKKYDFNVEASLLK
jgi:hypothetical protein